MHFLHLRLLLLLLSMSFSGGSIAGFYFEITSDDGNTVNMDIFGQWDNANDKGVQGHTDKITYRIGLFVKGTESNYGNALGETNGSVYKVTDGAVLQINTRELTNQILANGNHMNVDKSAISSNTEYVLCPTWVGERSRGTWCSDGSGHTVPPPTPEVNCELTPSSMILLAHGEIPASEVEGHSVQTTLNLKCTGDVTVNVKLQDVGGEYGTISMGGGYTSEMRLNSSSMNASGININVKENSTYNLNLNSIIHNNGSSTSGTFEGTGVLMFSVN